MLDLVKGETERIDSRFLEPACGSGNFLVAILRRKLAAVELKYGSGPFDPCLVTPAGTVDLEAVTGRFDPEWRVLCSFLLGRQGTDRCAPQCG